MSKTEQLIEEAVVSIHDWVLDNHGQPDFRDDVKLREILNLIVSKSGEDEQKTRIEIKQIIGGTNAVFLLPSATERSETVAPVSSSLRVFGITTSFE